MKQIHESYKEVPHKGLGSRFKACEGHEEVQDDLRGLVDPQEKR